MHYYTIILFETLWAWKYFVYVHVNHWIIVYDLIVMYYLANSLKMILFYFNYIACLLHAFCLKKKKKISLYIYIYIYIGFAIFEGAAN